MRQVYINGEFKNEDHAEDTDLFALNEGFVSVVPTQFDLTAYKALENFKKLEQ